MSIAFRDFMGRCDHCGTEFITKLLEGELVYEDHRAWRIMVYPDYQTKCKNCGKINKIALIYKATSYARMANGE